MIAKMIEENGQLFHIAAFVGSDGVTQLGHAPICQGTEHRFSFCFGAKWWHPIDNVIIYDRTFKLVDKTKRGMFKYEEINAATTL